MPSRFVVQPNGLLARFSTVVDDFTAINMTERDAEILIAGEYLERARHDTAQAIQRAKEEREKRWPEALDIIRAVHGEETARSREAENE